MSWITWIGPGGTSFVSGWAIGYSPTFRLGAERKADLFAIEHGFAEEINATKRFLLEDSNIPNSYKERLSKYYMTVEEVERIVLKRSRLQELS
jgi:hypothetical protein